MVNLFATLDYCYYSAYFLNVSKDHTDRKFGALGLVGMMLFTLTTVFLCLFSEYVFDLFGYLVEICPWQERGYRSLKDPRAAPAIFAGVAAILLTAVRYSGARGVTTVEKWQREGYKSSGILALFGMFGSVFLTPFAFSNPELTLVGHICLHLMVIGLARLRNSSA